MKHIIRIILICYVVFQSSGINGVWNLFKNLLSIIWYFFKFVNLVSVQITGDGMLTQLFLHPIVWIFVGYVFVVCNIQKGFFGKLCGKITY